MKVLLVAKASLTRGHGCGDICKRNTRKRAVNLEFLSEKAMEANLMVTFNKEFVGKTFKAEKFAWLSKYLKWWQSFGGGWELKS